MEKIEIGQRAIIVLKNGRELVGPWVGTGTFNNRAIVGVGKRNEFLDEVERIEIVDSTTKVYDASAPL